MILDKVRTIAFNLAISKSIQKDDIVFDLGSGSGILAFFAAKMGAKKVYAFERTDMADIIMPLAKHNHLDDKIIVIKQEIIGFDWASIEDKPTLIISETIGNLPPYEDIHAIFKSFSNHYKHNFKVIPESYKLSFFACRTKRLQHIKDNLGTKYDLSFGPLLDKILATPIYVQIVPDEVYSYEYYGPDISFFSDFPQKHQFELEIIKEGEIASIGVGFDLSVIKNINILNSPNSYKTSWLQLILPLPESLYCYPSDVLRGELIFPDAKDKKTWKWNVELFKK